MNVRVAHKTGELPKPAPRRGHRFTHPAGRTSSWRWSIRPSESAAAPAMSTFRRRWYAALQRLESRSTRGCRPRLAREIFDVRMRRAEWAAGRPTHPNRTGASPRSTGSDPPRLRSEALPASLHCRPKPPNRISVCGDDGLRLSDRCARREGPRPAYVHRARWRSRSGQAFALRSPPTAPTQSVGLKQQCWVGGGGRRCARPRLFENRKARLPRASGCGACLGTRSFSAPPETEAGIVARPRALALRWSVMRWRPLCMLRAPQARPPKPRSGGREWILAPRPLRQPDSGTRCQAFRAGPPRNGPPRVPCALVL